MKDKNPIVFISYSHDSKEHQDKVLKLANDLRSEGIDCMLDQYEDSPPEGWPKWMDRGVEKSDFVLVVCTETYYNRVMGTDEKGMGIKWESTLIYQQLYNAGSNNTKFIPVIFTDGKFEHIPVPLQGATFYNVDNEGDFDKLYWRLRGIKSKKPELGKLRELPVKERRTLWVSDLINQDEWEEAKWKNGVGYLMAEKNGGPPIIVLYFETMEQGQKLFSGLIDKIGNEDKQERLRVSIVEGEVPHRRNGYFVVIGENIEVTEKIVNSEENAESINYIAINQRFHRIYTETESLSLKKFKEEYKKYQCCYIAPGIQNNDGKSERPFEADFSRMIFKRKIEFRNYSDISEFYDPESILKTERVQKRKF